MAVYGNMVLTQQGQALYAKAQTGTQLNFTRMQIGSGQLAVGQDPTLLTALITLISYFLINSVSSSGSTAYVKGIFENTNITVPTYSCELGLFATDPVAGEILYAYANAGTQGDTIPAISSGPLSKQFQINAAIGNATSVTATIPADSYVPVSQKGVANGVASLNVDGEVPISQLPQVVLSLPQLLHASDQSFARSTHAGRINGEQVPANVLRLEQGKFRHAPFIEEATTNLAINSGFETVTGTQQVFADPLTGYTGATAPPWTLQNGSFTFGAGGATSGALSALITAGNPVWKPLTGSNGSSLSQTVQATFTTPATLSSNNNGLLLLFESSGNGYEAYLGNSSFIFNKVVGGVTTNLASIAFTPSISTSYIISISISPSGALTAHLKDTGGTDLIAPLPATDTSLTGGFLIGVGGDTGVVISAASVTAPFADAWTIGGDTRAAWALTQNAISGDYSVSVVSINSPASTPGIYATNNFTVSPATMYTASCYLNTNGATGAQAQLQYYNGATPLTSIYTSLVTGTTKTERASASLTSDSTANSAAIILLTTGAGTVVFDAIQLEQKAYATTYIENSNTTAGVTATRNADLLTYDLQHPLPSAWSGAFMWVPEMASNTTMDKTIASFTDANATGFRYLLHYKSGYFELAKFDMSGTVQILVDTVAVSFNANDKIFLEIYDNPASDVLSLTYSINGGVITTVTGANNLVLTDVGRVYLGCRYDDSLTSGTGGANGTVEALISSTLPTADQIQALAQASDWGLGDYPSALPDKVQIGRDGEIQRHSTSDFSFHSPNGTSMITGLRGTLVAGNVEFVNGIWHQMDPTKPSILIVPTVSAGAPQTYYMPPGSSPWVGWPTGYFLAQVLSGGYKMQSGITGALNASTAQTINFPVPFSGALPVITVIPGNSGAAYCSIVSVSATSFSFISSIANIISYDWIAIGV